MRRKERDILVFEAILAVDTVLKQHALSLTGSQILELWKIMETISKNACVNSLPPEMPEDLRII
jgi:hypothetical protein